MATYQSALDWAQIHRPYQVSLILQLGKPRKDTGIDTAMVSAERSSSPDKWEFVYNPEFFHTLSDSQAVGVMTHEVYHILLHHLEELFENQKSDPKIYPHNQKLVMAHECIVNDNVINDGHDLPDNLIIGFERLGFDTSSYSTKEVYDLIPDDDEMLQNPGDFDVCGVGDLTEDELKDLVDALKGVVGQISEEDAEKMGPVKAIKDGQKQTFSKAGTEFQDSSAYAQKMDVGEAWVDFIRKINPDFLDGSGLFGKQRTTWVQPRRKFAYAYPKMLLPNKVTIGDSLKRDGGTKPHIVLALDFSGSIDRSMTQKMAQLARSIPDSIEVDCCTFSTEYVPFDHTKEKNYTASGGTNFSAVEAFVRSLKRNDYPSAVVVITDGGARFYSEEQPTDERLKNNWYWVATETVYISHIKRLGGVDPTKVYNLKDLF